MLSRAGQRVVILEQHYIAGGCTHVFKEQGIEFDTGIHYIGEMTGEQKLFDLITSESDRALTKICKRISFLNFLICNFFVFIYLSIFQ